MMIAILLFTWAEHLRKQRAAAIISTFILGSLGYAFMVSVLFLFCFSPDEMQELRGFARYFDSYVLGEFLTLEMMFFLRICQGKLVLSSKLKSDYWTITLLALFVVADSALAPGWLKTQALQDDPYQEYRLLAERISEMTQPDSQILLVYDASTIGTWYGCVQSIMSYYDNDRIFPLSPDLCTINYEDPESVSAVEKEVKNYNYVYIINDNGETDKWLQHYLTEYKIINTGEAYQIRTDSETLSYSLVPVQRARDMER